ncbi:hypothetical protein AYK20_01580 [Thermoplasmatales archaeon SG8-52-1]|nr:MAG: hypothetical protein AYK20_01580 [Thermoplasmatales archaeon SG8-52-1]
MYPFYLELELIKPVSDYFKKNGYKVRYEIKIGFCRADIVAFKGERTIAVELKISDWKKAIIQAKNYQLGCDYVYLAVPLLRSYNILRKADFLLKKEGIGLLVINEKTCVVSKIVNAKRSNKQLGKISLDKIDKKMFRISKYKFL